MGRKIGLLIVFTILMASMTAVAAQEAKSNQIESKGGSISQTIFGAINSFMQNDEDPNNSPIEAEKGSSDTQVAEKKDRVEDALSASARKGRNPQTGKEIKIPAKKVVKFKPGAELSERVKASGPGNSTDTENLYMVELSETDDKNALDAFIDTTTKTLKLSDTDGDGRVNSVTIPGKSVEQDSYREGDEAEYERKTWGQPSFEELGINSETDAGYELGEEFTVRFGNSEVTGYSVNVRPIAGSQNRLLVSATGRTEYEDLTMSRGAKQGEKMAADNGGKTVGAGQITDIIELTGDDGSKALKKGNRVALALNKCNQECVDAMTEVVAEQTGQDVPVEELSVDGDLATESVTIAFDEMIRTEAARPNNSDDGSTEETAGPPTYEDLEMERGVKPGETKLHDWFEDVRAGKADEGRKEISVKLLNEEGQTQTRWDYTEEQVADELSGSSLENGHIVIEMDGDDVGKIPTEELDLSTEEMVDRHGPMKTGRFEIQLTTKEDSDNSTAEFTADGDSAMGQEELTIAYDRYKRTQ